MTVLGPKDPRARRREDAIASGSTMADFDRFLDSEAGQELIALVEAELEGDEK